MTTQELPSSQIVQLEPGRRRPRLPDGWWVVAFTALAFALRAPNLGRAYWIDEGITVGISSHPLNQIPSLLRQDGSPPFFYLLLHFWMRLFGSSEVATHVLPLALSLVTVPVAYWAGTTLFDRRAGLAGAALLATNPFLNWYSTETRMYPLVVCLSLVAVTLAWKAVRERSPLAGAGAVVAFAALLYTHDWGIYLTGITAAVLLGLAAARRDRVLAGAVALGVAAVVVLWLPWMPSFLDQAQNTAAPWAVRPNIGDFFADPASALGGTLGFLVAPLLVGGVVWARRLRPLEHGSRSGLLAAIGMLTALAGFLGAQIQPSWTVRYLAVIIGPLLLAAAGALSSSERGRAVLTGTCALLVGWSAIGSLLPNINARYAKSNVAAVANQIAPFLHRGDVVVVTQTEQLAVVAHYLPAGVEYVTPTGPVNDPYVVDWRNLVHRLQLATPCQAVAPVVNAAPAGTQIVEIDPAKRLGASGTSWSKAVNSQVLAINALLASDPSLTEETTAAPALRPRPFSPVSATVYMKHGGVGACR